MSLGSLASSFQNAVTALNGLTKQLKAMFPSTAWTSSATATIGASGAPPAQVAGYFNVIDANGVARKIPYYNP